MGKQKYTCDACEFSTDRINSLVFHRKGHTGMRMGGVGSSAPSTSTPVPQRKPFTESHGPKEKEQLIQTPPMPEVTPKVKKETLPPKPPHKETTTTTPSTKIKPTNAKPHEVPKKDLVLKNGLDTTWTHCESSRSTISNASSSESSEATIVPAKWICTTGNMVITPNNGILPTVAAPFPLPSGPVQSESPTIQAQGNLDGRGESGAISSLQTTPLVRTKGAKKYIPDEERRHIRKSKSKSLVRKTYESQIKKRSKSSRSSTKTKKNKKHKGVVSTRRGSRLDKNVAELCEVVKSRCNLKGTRRKNLPVAVDIETPKDGLFPNSSFTTPSLTDLNLKVEESKIPDKEITGSAGPRFGKTSIERVTIEPPPPIAGAMPVFGQKTRRGRLVNSGAQDFPELYKNKHHKRVSRSIKKESLPVAVEKVDIETPKDSTRRISGRQAAVARKAKKGELSQHTPQEQLPPPEMQLPTPEMQLPTPEIQLPTPEIQLPTPEVRLATEVKPASNPIAPTPPSALVTDFVPKLQPNTSVNVEQLSPFQNVATTQFRVLMPKTISDERVPEDMNPLATQLPLSVARRSNIRINMGNPTPTPPTPAPNPLHHINIVHKGNGTMICSSKNGNVFTNLNEQKQISSQGTRKNLPSPPTNDVVNSRSPEDVISRIESLTAHGGPKRAAGAVSHFTTTEFRSLRFESYRPNMPNNITRNLVTFSEFGILFNTPHTRSEAIVKCGIPADQILSIHAHFPNRLPLLAITTTLRYASWLRERLGMNNSPSVPNFYCPSRGGPSEKYLFLIMGDNFQAMDVGVIKRIYKRCIIDIDFSKANSLLVDSVEEKTHSQLIPAPVVVVPIRPPPPTPVRPALSTPISVVQTPNTRNSVKTNPVEEAKVLLTMKLGNKQLATSILTTDILCLAKGQFLNDQMIDFWLEYVISGLSETDRARTHVFSTYFYKCLTTRPKQHRSCAPWEYDPNLTAATKRHCRVKKWTKNVDIFSKDFIIIPINENAHWFLAVICFPGIIGICSMEDGTQLHNVKNTERKKKKKPEDMEEDPYVDPDRDEEVGCPDGEMQFETDEHGLTEAESDKKPRVKQPCIVTFDSMPNESRDRVYATLREYIRVEHNVRKSVERTFTRNEMPGYKAVVPDQPNHYDCGIYVLQYVESFFSTPLKSFLLPLAHLTHWFEDSIVHTKRKEIYEKICDLIKIEHPENVPYIPALKFNPPPPSSPSISVSGEQEPQPGSSKPVITNTTKRPHTGDDSGPKTKTPCHSN